MNNVIEVASYIVDRYKRAFGDEIDEMKLQKMMYFAQRESYVMDGEPLFDAVFYGWKYGPVLKEVRGCYKDNSFVPVDHLNNDEKFVAIMDSVFERYAEKNSWSLSRLTHGELSWKNSRIGIPEDANGDVPLKESDIIEDAKRIRLRMILFSDAMQNQGDLF